MVLCGVRKFRRKVITTYTVAVGKNLNKFDGSPSIDRSCGHKHKSILAASKCGQKLYAPKYVTESSQPCAAWQDWFIINNDTGQKDGYRAKGWLQCESVSLSFRRLRYESINRCLRWHPNGLSSWTSSDWLTAVTGELGELASLIKMRNRERDNLQGNKFSPTHKQIADELADIVTYLDLLAAALNVDLGEAVKEKFNEVSERMGFPERL